MGGGVKTHPLPPADPSGEALLQAGRVQRASQHLAEGFLQDVLDHVVFLQRHVLAAPPPRPGQHHHVAAAARGLKKGDKDSVLKDALGTFARAAARDTHCLDAELQEPRAESGLELVGEVFVSQSQFAMSAVSKCVQQTAVFNRHKRRGQSKANSRLWTPVAVGGGSYL